MNGMMAPALHWEQGSRVCLMSPPPQQGPSLFWWRTFGPHPSGKLIPEPPSGRFLEIGGMVMDRPTATWTLIGSLTGQIALAWTD